MILDSSVVIAAERRGDTVVGLLRLIASVAGDQQAALSAIGLTELVHAIYRTQLSAVRARRESFIEDLLTNLEVVPYTRATASLAGRIDGEQRAGGVTIPSMDLLIEATALEHSYSVATANTRHFELIPDLKIVSLL